MRYVQHLAVEILFISLFHLVSSRWACAYIDPGSGSFILQLIIGGLLGASFAIKIYWRRIKAFLAKLLHSDKRKNQGDD